MHITRKAKQDYWANTMQEWEASGETQVAFCERKKIKHGNFSKWRQRLKIYNDAVGTSDAAHFIEAQITGDSGAPKSKPTEFKLSFSNGTLLTIPLCCTAAQWNELFSALGIAT